MSFMRLSLASLKRPKLLVEAARHGSATYMRSRDLRSLIAGQPQKTNEQILESLGVQERLLDHDRRENATTYSVTKHIAVLSALLAEMRVSQAA